MHRVDDKMMCDFDLVILNTFLFLYTCLHYKLQPFFLMDWLYKKQRALFESTSVASVSCPACVSNFFVGFFKIEDTHTHKAYFTVYLNIQSTYYFSGYFSLHDDFFYLSNSTNTNTTRRRSKNIWWTKKTLSSVKM